VEFITHLLMKRKSNILRCEQGVRHGIWLQEDGIVLPNVAETIEHCRKSPEDVFICCDCINSMQKFLKEVRVRSPSRLA